MSLSLSLGPILTHILSLILSLILSNPILVLSPTPPLVLSLTHTLSPTRPSVPEHWITDDGQVRLCVAKGTLVPSKTLRCGHPQACHAARCLSLMTSSPSPPTPNP